jgi:hypothetical protein
MDNVREWCDVKKFDEVYPECSDDINTGVENEK